LEYYIKKSGESADENRRLKKKLMLQQNEVEEIKRKFEAKNGVLREEMKKLRI